MSEPQEPQDPHARLRVALYAADGTVRGVLSGTLATVKANVPPGGSWRIVDAGVRRVGDVPKHQA